VDQDSLGFDSTIKPDPGNKGRFIITVHPDGEKQNPKRFQTTQILSLFQAEPIRGRGTRVYEAIEMDENGNSTGSHVVLKDTWIDSDRKREGSVLDSMRAAADGADTQLFDTHFLTKVYHGDVWIELDILDDTANGLMCGLNITSGQVSLFELQRRPVQRSEPPSGSEGLRTMSSVKARDPDPRYVLKTHYRVVFKEICIPIYRIKSLPEVITVLSETVSGTFWYGTVHL
jgi:hypothetical protein